MKRSWFALGLFLGVVSTALAGDGNADPRVLDAIRALGGIVDFEEQQPGEPTGGAYLGGDRIGAKELKLLTLLPGLWILNVERAKVTEQGLKILGELTELEMLCLSETQLSDAGFVHLKPLQALHYLDLSHTAVTDQGLVEIGQLCQLQALHLEGTKVTDTGLGHLKSLTNLWTLGLENTAITDKGLADLVALRNLTSLNLGGTKVTDAGLGLYLSQFAALERLDLSETAVSDLGLWQLRSLRKLRWLDVSKTRVTQDGIQRLRQALPDLKVDG